MSSHRLRHLLTLASCGSLVAGLALLPAGPASAAVAANYAAQASASTSSSCTLTSGSDSSQSSIASLSGGTRTRSVNLAASFTNSGDPSDVVSMSGHYATSMSIGKQGGDLAKVQLSGRGSVRVNASKGSATACDPQAIVEAATELQFTESHAGWLFVDRQTVSHQGFTLALVEAQSTGRSVVFDTWQGGGSSAVSRGFLKPGTFGSEILVALTAGNVPPVITKSNPRSSVSVEFHRSGSAVSGTSGNGGKFVRFPGSVSCSHHKATLSWSSKAGQVARGSFSVNGRHKATVSGPHAGRHVVLRHLSSTADTTITADLSLKGGGHATASRLYVPCQG